MTTRVPISSLLIAGIIGPIWFVTLVVGKVKPVIDRQYGLTQVAEAIRYLSKGHAHGKVVITM